MNDLMRLPLGILIGVGFIGGGAILRRDNLVVGVTKAATIWLGTVIGVCLGGGQIALGSMATLLGLFALWVLKWVESSLRQGRYGRLVVELGANGPSEAEIRRRIGEACRSSSAMSRSILWANTESLTSRFVNSEGQRIGSLRVLSTHWQARRGSRSCSGRPFRLARTFHSNDRRGGGHPHSLLM